MKRYTCIFIALCLAALLMACGGKTGAQDQQSQPAEDTAAQDRQSQPAEDTAAADDTSEETILTEPGTTEVVSEDAKPTASSQSSDSEKTGDTEGDENSADIADSGNNPETSAPKARLLYMGHASIRITTPEEKVIYIDPFAGSGYDPAADLILITHAHFDHNNPDMITNRNPDCSIITWAEALADGRHQTFDLGFATVEAVEAGYNQNHNVNECVGYVITLSDGVSIYVSGDTSTTLQMPALADKEIDYAFFCCDGVYNMDLNEAAICADMVNAKHSIPYHVIAASGDTYFDRARAEQFDVSSRLIIDAGEEIELTKE